MTFFFPPKNGFLRCGAFCANSQGLAMRGAFSLIELLVVIAIIVVLSSLSVMVTSSMRFSFHGELAKTVGILELAHQTAVTQSCNTYVGFSSSGEMAKLPIPVPLRPVTYAAAFLSVDGSDVFPSSGTAVNEADGTVRLIDKLQLLRSVELEDALPSDNALAGTLLPAGLGPNTGWRFTFQPKTYSPMTSAASVVLDRIIKFTPQGTVLVDSAPVEVVEIVLEPSGKSRQASVIRINGLTGRVTVYQPGESSDSK
jgi:prepilin-type N-terminal cleavage/methylation domain-containing protein